MNRTIFLTGIIFGILAIGFGAFGAHGLENLLEDKSLTTFETGVRYQMYHALFLLILANLKNVSRKSKKTVYAIIVAGILLFSFSIYALATNSLTSFDFKVIAFLTPIGGVLLLIGWVLTGLKFKP